MQNVLEVVAFDRFFRVEQFQELLDKLRSNEDFQLADFHGLVDHKLQEEFVDALQVWPGRIHFFVLVDARLRQREVRLLHVGKRAEDVLLDH